MGLTFLKGMLSRAGSVAPKIFGLPQDGYLCVLIIFTDLISTIELRFNNFSAPVVDEVRSLRDTNIDNLVCSVYVPVVDGAFVGFPICAD